MCMYYVLKLGEHCIFRLKHEKNGVQFTICLMKNNRIKFRLIIIMNLKLLSMYVQCTHLFTLSKKIFSLERLLNYKSSPYFIGIV